MGLHNRFPSYFYKRGNLFNTYLDHVDGETLLQEKSARRSRSERPKAAPRARPSQASVEAGARLGRFAREHLSLTDTERLFRLIAAGAGVRIEWRAKLDARLPLALGQFVAEHVAPDEAARYVAVLEERMKRGEPPIQK